VTDVFCKCAGCKVSKAPQWMTKGTENLYLHCSKCHDRTHETYSTDAQLCSKCAWAEKQSQKLVIVTPLGGNFTYENRWAVTGSASPYIVSEAKDGNWACSCMAWTRTHPREDCKHILRIKLQENTPAPAPTMSSAPSLAVITYTGRKMR